jgi:hypothetical protein
MIVNLRSVLIVSATPLPTPYIPPAELTTAARLPNGDTTPCLSARNSAIDEVCLFFYFILFYFILFYSYILFSIALFLNHLHNQSINQLTVVCELN